MSSPTARQYIQHLMTPSESGMRSTIERVNARGLLVIGSIGRSVVFNVLSGNPNLEFEERGEELLRDSSGYRWGYDGIPRDVDVLGGPALADPEDFESYIPHLPDDRACIRPKNEIVHTETGWWFGRRGRESIKLDDRLFEAWEGEAIFGIHCRTVSPVLHHVLLDGTYQRPKDILAQKLLDQAMHEEHKDLLSTEPYVSFRDLIVHG